MRKISSAVSRSASVRVSVSSTSTSSHTSSRVIPARHPVVKAGVDRRPPRPRKMFVPVPSHNAPTVLAKIASPAWRALAWARATTFSAYDVALAPAIALRSFRTQGTRTTRSVAGHGGEGAAARITVHELPARPDPSGPEPAVTVMRSRAGLGAGGGQRREQLAGRAAERVVVHPRVETEDGQRAAKPEQVPRQGERRPTDDLQRLEDAVAHRQAVVQRSDLGLAGCDDPCHPAIRGCPPAQLVPLDAVRARRSRIAEHSTQGERNVSVSS